MAERELHPVYCQSCGTQVAVATGKPMHTVYCNDICAGQPRLTENEERDDLIELLARTDTVEWHPARLAIQFELSRQGVLHILSKRLVS